MGDENKPDLFSEAFPSNIDLNKEMHKAANKDNKKSPYTAAEQRAIKKGKKVQARKSKAGIPYRGKDALVDVIPKVKCNKRAISKMRARMIGELAAKGITMEPEISKRVPYPDLKAMCIRHGIEPDTWPKADNQCAVAAVPGTTVCRHHGGSSPAIIARAKERILELVEPAIMRLGKIATKSTHHPAAVAACKDLLDRAGLKAIDKIEINPGYTLDDLSALTEEELALFIQMYKKVRKPVIDVESVDVTDHDQQNSDMALMEIG